MMMMPNAMRSPTSASTRITVISAGKASATATNASLPFVGANSSAGRGSVSSRIDGWSTAPMNRTEESAYGTSKTC